MKKYNKYFQNKNRIYIGEYDDTTYSKFILSWNG